MIQADGGTRTASITGAYVALYDAVNYLLREKRIAATPLRDPVAAVSVGVYQGVPVLDLDYAEDSACDTDMNVVMTAGGGFVEVQGTAEGAPFSRAEMEAMLDLAQKGIGAAGCSAARRAELETESRGADDEQAGHRIQQLPASCARSRAILAPLAIEVVPQAHSVSPKPRSRTAPSSKTRWPRRAMPAGSPGCRRWPMIPASACMRWAASPACIPRVMPASRPCAGREIRPQQREAAARSTGAADRRAHYYCVIVLVRHADDPQPLIAEGEWHGEILPRRAARAASATTRCSDPGIRHDRRRTAAAGKEPRQPPRPGAGGCWSNGCKRKCGEGA